MGGYGSPGLPKKADERWQKFYPYKQEDFTIPGNLHKIKAPGLNQEIWDHLPRPSRKSDKGFLRQQQMLQAVAISTEKNGELFLKELRTDRENATLKSALSTSLDSISMLGSISFSLGKTRRYRLKNVLNEKINHICDIRYDADDVQGRTSDWLFGDDLNETIARGRRIGSLRLPSAFLERNTPSLLNLVNHIINSLIRVFVVPASPAVLRGREDPGIRGRGDKH